MSRRDTIIIAILVNAGLLMVLFATALRSDHPKEKGGGKLLVENVPNPTENKEAVGYTMATTLPVPTLAKNITEEIALATLPPPIEKPVAVEVPPPKPLEKPSLQITVKKGDFLEKIAKAHNTTVAAIMEENRLSSSQLKIGQILTIPTTTSAKQEVAKAPAAPLADEYYIVKEGDNPWTIASKNQLSLQELLRINHLDEQKARRLRPGDRLKIR